MQILLRALPVLVMACCAITALDASAQDKASAATPTAAYKVVDGFKVDPNTMNGFRAWRAAACDRCHGANQQGLVGPSLLDTFKTLSKEEFVKIVTEGRLDKGMPSFKTSQTVMDNVDGLYAYLKGRSNGDITQARVQELKQ
jgi:mono/diheme cytochrome c family protein